MMQQIYPTDTTALIRAHRLRAQNDPSVSDTIDFLLGGEQNNNGTDTLGSRLRQHAPPHML